MIGSSLFAPLLSAENESRHNKTFPSSAGIPEAELIPFSLLSPLPKTQERLQPGGLQHTHTQKKNSYAEAAGFSDRKKSSGLANPDPKSTPGAPRSCVSVRLPARMKG